VVKRSQQEHIDEVERRLVRKFPHLSTGLIATAVEDAHVRLQHSAITDYIPLLVERRAHNELALLASQPDLSIEFASLVSDPDVSTELVPSS
jgi:hypothetical protein